MMDDAQRINILKDKETSETLSEDEKEELNFRENSELFLDVFEDRDTALSVIPQREKPIKEAFYPIYQIKGVVDGKEVILQKHVYPKFTQEELAEESNSIEPFYMYNWDGPIINEYTGETEGEAITKEEAEELFLTFESFAKKRSQEIRSLKKEKETNKYGHEIGNEAYEYRVLKNADDDRFIEEKKREDQKKLDEIRTKIAEN